MAHKPAPVQWTIPFGVEHLPFGSFLRAYRTAAGLSQNRLARLADIDPAYVNRMELERSGGKTPSRAVVHALGEALGLPPSELDYFLFKAGYAPTQDWQARALRAEEDLRQIRLVLGAEDGKVPPDTGGPAEDHREGEAANAVQ